MSDHRKLILWEVGMIAAVVATYLVSRILDAPHRIAAAFAVIATIVTTGMAVFVAMLEDWLETPTKKQYDLGCYFPSHEEEEDSETLHITPRGDKIGCAIFGAIIILILGCGIAVLGVGFACIIIPCSNAGSFIAVGIVILGIMVVLTTSAITTKMFANIEPSTHKTTGYITFFGILASLFLGGVLPETVPRIVDVIPGLVAIALLGLLALRKH